MPRLAGHKLLLTRSAEDAAGWAAALAAEGATTVILPCIRTESIATPGLGEQLAEADWLVVTSRRGADAVAALLAGAPPAALKLAAIGAATAERLGALCGRVDSVDSVDPVDPVVALTGTGTAAALAAELTREPSIRGARVVLALAENAGETLARTLKAAGTRVERFDVYRTVPAAAIEPKLALSTLGCDTVIFASASAVAGFANQVDVDTRGLFVTIGPSTSAALRARGLSIAAEAKEPSLSGIIESVLESTHVEAPI